MSHQEHIDKAKEVIEAAKLEWYVRNEGTLIPEPRVPLEAIWIEHVAAALQELEARTIERCAKVAMETKYDRLCEPHEAECRTTHHGCEEISRAIRDLRQ